jgi:ubiquinone/menaquinone biosynthesis C-methylase UbiE
MNHSMRKRTALLVVALAAAFAASLLARAGSSASDEISRLAELMQWKPGSVVADVGAGDGRYAFAAAEHVPSGRVFATEIDAQKLDALRAEVKRKNLQNVQIVESKEADTNLPAQCCDAIFLRRVYHHLTKPGEFDAAMVRSLKPGGRLAIIDFPPRRGLAPVEGVPANRGGHGIPKKIVIQELTASGLQLEKTVDDWPENSYCVVFMKK